MCPDDGVEEPAALQAFRFGRQATPAPPQAVCPHHCETGERGGVLTVAGHMTSRYVGASPSLTIPTARHFWKRQNWQRFLLRLSTGQLLEAKHT